ncbi:hypothetical protein [Amycolatopsis sp. NPDC021455]|uniref:hypothetical protein n=1 Tax=Amycolatopsis sp. NPDC021455 TaxID=3154901 RepID=UPI0033DEA2D0
MTAVLTTASTLLCAHQLPVKLTSGQTSLRVDSDPAVTESDVTGMTFNCGFTSGPPCTSIKAVTLGVSAALKVGDDPVLLQSAQGLTNVGPWTIGAGGQTKLEAA